MTSRRTLTRSFITTIAAVATAAVALGAGCSNEVVVPCDGCGGASNSSSATGNPPACPDLVPVAGESCAQEGLSCSYGEDACDPVAVCDEGSWQVSVLGECNPPPCPVEQPYTGDSCAGHLPGDTCLYDSKSCPGLTVNAICQQDGAWLVDEIFCNPPPPEHCYGYIEPESCLQQPDCDWQVPGCGDFSLQEAGCFPQHFSCDVDPWICLPDQTCAQVSVNPCWDEPCDACGEQRWLCVNGGPDTGG